MVQNIKRKSIFSTDYFRPKNDTNINKNESFVSKIKNSLLNRKMFQLSYLFFSKMSSGTVKGRPSGARCACVWTQNGNISKIDYSKILFRIVPRKLCFISFTD
jgi:hypothetical protein